MFRINKLKISGFKSFPYSQDINIEDGITGIIGPNGCGKSNIFEAIRWVMGETSSKSLRSSSMDEVIFSGTDKLPAKNIAEVSIELDNSKKNFKGKFYNEDKIIISRTIERGMGSFYRINNRDVRAKEVSILFSDSGSGARSSSIISQGNIDQIINFKPIERKVILEDAAGISGLQARRHESELKLSATELNLERLSDLIDSSEKQRQSLKRQSRQAERYQKITEQITQKESALIYFRWKNSLQELNNASESFSSIKKELENLGKKISEDIEKYESDRTEVNKLENEILNTNSTLQNEISRKNNLVNKQESFEIRKDEIESYLNSTIRDQKLEKKRLVEFDENIKNIQSNFSKLLDTKDLKKNLEIEKKKDEQLQKILKISETKLFSDMQLLLGEEFKQDKLKESKQFLQKKKDNLIMQINEANNLMNLEKQNKSNHCLADLKKSIKINVNKIKDLKRLNHKIFKNKQIIETEKLQKENELKLISNKLTEKSTEILTLQKLTKNINLSSKSIFNIIKIKNGYEDAVYSALSHELDAELEQTEKRWVHKRYAKNLNELHENLIPLKRFVDIPKQLEAIISQIAYVKTKDEGFKNQDKLKIGQSIVSFDGSLWRWDSFVSEKINKKKNWFDYKKRISELDKQALDLEKKLYLKNEKVRQLLQKNNKLKNIEDKNILEIENFEIALQNKNKELLELKDKESVVENNIEKFLEKINFLNIEKESIEKEIIKIQKQEDAKNDLTNNKKTCDTTNEENNIKAIKEKIYSKRKLISQINEKIVGVEIRLKYFSDDLIQNKKRKQESTDQLNILDTRIKQLKEEQNKLSNEPTNLKKNIELLEINISKIRNSINSKQINLENKKNIFEKKKLNNKKNIKDKETLNDSSIRLEEKIRHLTDQQKEIRDSIFQKFKYQPEELIDKFAIDEFRKQSIEELKENIQRLSFQREQMGPVNLRAYIEEKELAERLEIICSERDDLYLAIKKLRLAINQINAEGKNKLIKAFDAVKKNFSDLFKKFFDGGDASLELIKSDDPLQTGIEIYARPPGKKLSNISLLSGGEKTLTAISLIFSIFLINPSPICVLDEVDAALDEVNVEKFCKIMKIIKSETNTKFLIITHHKTTMAMVDKVYGITMSEKGISDLVSIDFDSETFKEAV